MKQKKHPQYFSTEPSLVVVHSYVLHAAFGDATQAVNSVDSVV